jgi:hypothetical protein
MPLVFVKVSFLKVGVPSKKWLILSEPMTLSLRLML